MVTQRNKKIKRSSVQKDGRADFLYQWFYSRKTQKGYKNSFVSIISKKGKFYVDKPYYCYGGPHRIRRIRGKIVLAIKLAVIRQNIADNINKIQNFIGSLTIKTIRIINNFTGKIRVKFRKHDPADPFGIYII